MAALGRGGSSPLPRTTSKLTSILSGDSENEFQNLNNLYVTSPFNLTVQGACDRTSDCLRFNRHGRVAELVYATDLKSVESNLVRVQVPPRPPEIITSSREFQSRGCLRRILKLRK